MSKTGPISQVEAFYIEHHYKIKDPQELADILDRKVTTIKTYIKNNFGTKITAAKAGDHFGRNEKGSVVMTETASMMGDAIKKNKNAVHKDCITKIKNV
jgi:hypothetical protein